MLQSKESKLKKMQELLTQSTLSKELVSSAKTAYTILGKSFNLKDAIGAIRSKDTDEDANESSFYCPNEKCGHVFRQPLVALQIQEDGETEFYACPRCLSEITVEDSMSPDTDKLEDDRKEDSENEQVLPPKASSGCLHHYGYLGERDSNAVIPEECMICKDLMDCLLKKAKK